MTEALQQEIRTLKNIFESERDPEGRAFAPLADAYRRAGEIQQAVRLLNQGLARHPDFVPGHVVAAQLYVEQGLVEEAAIAARKALALDAENVNAMGALLRVLESNADAEADEVRSRLTALDPLYQGGGGAGAVAVKSPPGPPPLPTREPVADAAADLVDAEAETVERTAIRTDEPPPSLQATAAVGALPLDLDLDESLGGPPPLPDLDSGPAEDALDVEHAVEIEADVSGGLTDEPLIDLSSLTIPEADALQPSSGLAPISDDELPTEEPIVDLADLPTVGSPDAEALFVRSEDPLDALPELEAAETAYDEPVMDLADLGPADDSVSALDVADLAPAGSEEDDDDVMALADLAPEDDEPVMDLADLAPEETEPVLDLADLAPDDVEPVMDLADLAPDDEEPVMELADLAPEDTEPVMELADLAPEDTEPVMDLSDLAPSEIDEDAPAMDLADLAPDEPEPVMDLADLAPEDAEPAVDLTDLAPDESEPVMDLSDLAPEEQTDGAVMELSDLAPEEDASEPVMELADLAPPEEEAVDLTDLAPEEHAGDDAESDEEEEVTMIDLVAQAPTDEPVDESDEDDHTPGEPIYTRTLAELYVKQGAIGQAIEVYEHLARRNPDDASIPHRIEELRAGDLDEHSAGELSGEAEEEVETLARELAANGDEAHDEFESPYTLHDEDDAGTDAADEDDTGPTIGDYFTGLLGWKSEKNR